jgi:probable phosphoglycerate mutase
MAHVWFIRHGESAANAGAATNDPATIPLTVNGVAQAEHVSTLFNHQPTLIVTSPFLRTRQTANPTIRRFPAAAVEVWQVQEFTYLSPATCANTTAAERRPRVAAYWERCDPDYVDGPGAESFSQLVARSSETIKKIRSTSMEFAAIFTHGQFIQITKLLLQRDCTDSSILMRDFGEIDRCDPIANGSILGLDL